MLTGTNGLIKYRGAVDAPVGPASLSVSGERMVTDGFRTHSSADIRQGLNGFGSVAGVRRATREELAACARRYACVNVKLDKAGGLTEALALARAARDAGLQLMVGCMVATSLAMAPALILAQGAEFVDLDGPLLLQRDREPGLRMI